MWEIKLEVILKRAHMIGRAVLGALAVWAGTTLCVVPALAQEAAPAEQAAATFPAGLLGPEDLRRVVSPVAFYPDDLLAIVLPASTNPLQIVQAQRFLDQIEKGEKVQPDGEWDPAILALINYPEVIAKMNANLNWTTALGNAVIDQLDDVMDMIQRLRDAASGSGYLQTNEMQVVYWVDDYWYIDSDDPDYIFVPDYPPDHPIFNPPDGSRPRPEHPIVYPPPPYVSHHPYWSPGAVFFAGAILGGAFGYGLDWGGNDIDINVGAECCGGRGDLGNRDRVDHRDGDRFNADKQRVNGRDKLTWSPNKARQRQQATTKAAGRDKAGTRNSAGTLPAKRQGTKATSKQPKLTNPALRNPADLSGNKNLRGEKKSSLGNYQSTRDTYRSREQGRRSMDESRSSRDRSNLDNRSRTRSNSGAFGGYNRGSAVRMQSSRGSRSMGGSRGGGRGGGRR